MTNILFIAFEFPPLNRGGVYRPLSFVKYLPQYGINPVVITLDPSTYEHVFDTYSVDESLAADIRDNASIIPVGAGKAAPPSRWQEFTTIYFSIHGNETDQWEESFYSAVDEAVRQYAPKAIFVTVPPFSVLPLAKKVAEKYALPLVLDFRDAWSQWRTVPYGTILHYWRTLQLEERYLSAADAIIATSVQTLDDFKRLHPRIPASRFHYIPNGYNGELLPWQPIDPGKKTYTVGYVGSFYFTPEARTQMLQPWWRKKGHRMLQYIPQKQDWLYRSPYFFFKALQQLNRQNPSLGQRITVKFAGKKPAWLDEMIRSFGLENQVTLIGEIPHRQSLLFQQECDALLITSAKQLGGRDYSIAGKTFEYLQMQRPVIAFACEGAQKDLLQEAGTALLCDPDDAAGSARLLADLFEGNTQLCPNQDFLATLSRRELTARLAGIIKNTHKHS
ncbi:glycosyltransferase [Puia dinghuensis]|uniref:Glycosyl transferase family 1 n=1 Tax=Puia dinghuensis TaxID=1792502 RepID=A0A8J2XU80_9BACT|nr:glycosyltransferase [Puia dinghuensis]GGB08511.1 glycosyl transferase family 1 [Puia dinghuensis]